MRITALRVEFTRNDNGIIAAHVIDRSGPKPQRGTNLLSSRQISNIDTATMRVREILLQQLGPAFYELEKLEFVRLWEKP